MRILLATDSFYPTVDSTTVTIKATVDRLVDLGHTVRIVAPGPGLRSYRGCEVVRVRQPESTGSQVRAAVDAFEPDVVQAHTPRHVGRKAVRHAARTGVRSIVVEQSAVLDLAADHWRSRIVEHADTVLVTSPWMVGRAAEMGVVAHLWEPGVDVRAFTPRLRDPWLHSVWSRASSPGGPRVVVGYVGGLHKPAGVRRLAGLAALPGLRVVVVGEGPERGWLTRRLPTARFTGGLSTGDLTVALPSLDVLVHPGEHETDCHTLRQAAASGVPLVAPRSGGARSVVDHLSTGVLYPPGSTRDLVGAVAAVAADPHRHLLGSEARSWALRRTWADAVDELLTRHLAVRAGARA